MKNHFIEIEGQIIHFKTAGNGAPIVLLHPSPNSSNLFIPLMEKLAKQSLVIALDTPGYGQSMPLSTNLKTITDYTSILKKFFKKIGLQKFSIYGSATGAQIGVRYALEYPQQVTHLHLDNAAHFSEEERIDILKQYFPDLTPQLDGSHLEKTWAIVKGLFQYFPWFKDTPEFKLNVPMPAVPVLHFIAKDFLVASKNYDLAYRAAFEHERAEFVQLLKVPTTIFFWEGSILKPYVKKLLAHNMPDNIKVVTIPADRMEREIRMVDSIFTNLKNKDGGKLINFEEVSVDKIQIDLTNYPAIELDGDGKYLLKAWQYLVNKNKNKSAEIIHNELKNWMSSI